MTFSIMALSIMTFSIMAIRSKIDEFNNEKELYCALLNLKGALLSMANFTVSETLLIYNFFSINHNPLAYSDKHSSCLFGSKTLLNITLKWNCTVLYRN